VPRAETTVPVGMPAPVTGMPTAICVPGDTDVTVIVLPEKDAA